MADLGLVCGLLVKAILIYTSKVFNSLNVFIFWVFVLPMEHENPYYVKGHTIKYFSQN